MLGENTLLVFSFRRRLAMAIVDLNFLGFFISNDDFPFILFSKLRIGDYSNLSIRLFFETFESKVGFLSIALNRFANVFAFLTELFRICMSFFFLLPSSSEEDCSTK